MKEVEVINMVKRYGNNTVVDNISFSVNEGEFFVLLGPSGGGKTTMLRLVCGLEKPDSGQIIIRGKDVTDIPPRERNIGMVFQDYGLYPNMNVYHNIAYGLEARGMPRSEVDKRVRSASAKLGLTEFLERNIVDLSGGEQQRVALARALAKDADVYLFDEPLSNLDPKLRASARRDIQTVHREKGKPSLYVTHDQTEALAIADRIAIIARGKLQQVGTPEELVTRPANMFVASFIGTPAMNLIRCTLARARDAFVVDADGITLRLPAHHTPALAAYPKDTIILGLQPNAVALADRATSFEINAGNMMVGRVENTVPLVGETIVNLKVGMDTDLAIILQESEETFSIGENLRIGIDPAAICLYDPDTELLLRTDA